MFFLNIKNGGSKYTLLKRDSFKTFRLPFNILSFQWLFNINNNVHAHTVSQSFKHFKTVQYRTYTAFHFSTIKKVPMNHCLRKSSTVDLKKSTVLCRWTAGWWGLQGRATHEFLPSHHRSWEKFQCGISEWAAHREKKTNGKRMIRMHIYMCIYSKSSLVPAFGRCSW